MSVIDDVTMCMNLRDLKMCRHCCAWRRARTVFVWLFMQLLRARTMCVLPRQLRTHTYSYSECSAIVTC